MPNLVFAAILLFGGHFVFWGNNVEGYNETPCKIWSFQHEN